MKAMLRGTLTALVGSLALFATSTAFADGEACYNDVDCPGTACGDAVCNWNKTVPVPEGRKAFYCNAAGTDPVGRDGWCTADSDCKCASQGAKCVGTYCSFTKPMAGTGGVSSTGGTTSSTGGTTSSTGGTVSSTGGTTSSTGGTPTSTGGAAASTDDGGGCSVSAPGGANGALALGVGLLGLGIACARRRQR